VTSGSLSLHPFIKRKLMKKKLLHRNLVLISCLLLQMRRRKGAYLYMECIPRESLRTTFLVVCTPSKQTHPFLTIYFAAVSKNTGNEQFIFKLFFYKIRFIKVMQHLRLYSIYKCILGVLCVITA
jgi:hypothetical protein